MYLHLKLVHHVGQIVHALRADTKEGVSGRPARSLRAGHLQALCPRSEPQKFRYYS